MDVRCRGVDLLRSGMRATRAPRVSRHLELVVCAHESVRIGMAGCTAGCVCAGRISSATFRDTLGGACFTPVWRGHEFGLAGNHGRYRAFLGCGWVAGTGARDNSLLSSVGASDRTARHGGAVTGGVDRATAAARAGRDGGHFVWWERDGAERRRAKVESIPLEWRNPKCGVPRPASPP